MCGVLLRSIVRSRCCRKASSEGFARALLRCGVNTGQVGNITWQLLDGIIMWPSVTIYEPIDRRSAGELPCRCEKLGIGGRFGIIDGKGGVSGEAGWKAFFEKRLDANDVVAVFRNALAVRGDCCQELQFSLVNAVLE